MIKRVLAVLTAFSLLCTAGAFGQAEASGGAGGYYKVAHSGESTDKVSAAGWNISVSGASPDGSGIACKTADGKNADWPDIIFEDITVPSGAGALIFWFGQEYIGRNPNNFLTDPEAVLHPFLQFYYRESGGSWSGNISAEGDVYFINGENGRVLSKNIKNTPITGTPSETENWGDFKNGYIVFPLELMFGNIPYGKTVDIRIRLLGNKSVYLGSDGRAVTDVKKISENTVITYDNFGFITDMAAFEADCGTLKPGTEYGKCSYADSEVLYKLAMLPADTEMSASAYKITDGIGVAWEPQAGASGYAVTAYDRNGAAISSVRTAGTAASLKTVSAARVQVLALDSEGLIAAAGAPVGVGAFADLNTDGEIDIRDLIRLKKLLAAGAEYNPAADLDGDGVSGAGDLTVLRRRLLGVGETGNMPDLNFEKYEDWSLPLGDGLPQSGSFSNTQEKQATPGQNSGSGATQRGNEQDYAESLLADRSKLIYCHEGESYVYGITADYAEVFALKDESGRLIDTVSGAGKAFIGGEYGTQFPVYGAIGFSEDTDGYGRTRLTVKYSGSGGEYSARLTFGRRSCGVEYYIGYSSAIPALAAKSYIDRGFLNSYDSYDCGVETGWTYPDDGDFPYKTTESFYTVHRFGGDNRMYTYLYSDNLPDYLWDFYVKYPKERLPMYFEDGNSVADTVKYSIVFENCAAEENPDYLARFDGKGLPAAVGAEPAEKNSEASSVFVGESVRLNLNVTNLESADTPFSLRYDIRDYYGRLVDEGTFINSVLPADESLDRILEINPGCYGMFYLNLMITTERGSYREVYPFILLEEYDYKYSESSPFGINQILGGDYEPYEDYINLAGKIGVAITRGTAFRENDLRMTENFINTARRSNIRLFGTGNGKYSYITAMESLGIDAFNSGNELNLPTISDSSKLDSAFADYLEDYFWPGYNNIKLRGHNYITAAVSGAQTKWLDKLYTEGLWDKFDTLAVHPYGYPYSPDLKTSGSQIWHVEHALKRTREAIDKYGEKDFYVTETGYPTQAGFKKAVDLRTQADYNTRSYMLSLAYGAKAVMAYCFTDYSNSGIGVSADDPEFNFGYFYYPDYYGRILPKPAAAAYANMTRHLESVTASCVSPYDDGNLVRAVKLTTELYGEVTVAWSNCAPQPNDAMPQTRPERRAAYPWVNTWQESYAVTLKASGGRVTVTDLMGNDTVYTASGGKVTVPLTGSPVIITGTE